MKDEILLIEYVVVNGTQVKKRYPLNIIVKTQEEIEKLRAELRDKHIHDRMTVYHDDKYVNDFNIRFAIRKPQNWGVNV